jgi:hypothetical protein|tara:strand:+ start:50 stop:649 length:600 start_codon:yes stop_codon:yes gene_type:complete
MITEKGKIMNTVTYTLDPKSLVVKGYESDKVARSMGNGVAFFKNADELLADRNVTGPLLVNAYNEIADKPVKKFSDNKTAAKRFMDAIADIHVTTTPFDGETKVKSPPQIDALPGMTPLGIAPKKVAKPRGSFAGKVINVLVTANPRKENTKEVCGYASFQLLLNHGVDMPYELYIKQGGRLQDLKWDIDHEWAEVKDA